MFDAKAAAETSPAFAPSFGLRSNFVQSLLSSKRPARWYWRRRGVDLSDAPQRILECSDGVRLSGYHNPQPDGVRASGLVVLIHGWEGHHESNYLYSMA